MGLETKITQKKKTIFKNLIFSMGFFLASLFVNNTVLGGETKINGVNLTNTIDYQELDPTFSPDGKKIAFRAYKYSINNVYLINNDGSGIERLTNINKTNRMYLDNLIFSPDGKKIAFVSSQFLFNYKEIIKTLYLIDLETKTQKKLEETIGDIDNIRFFPNNKQLAFRVSDIGRGDIYMINCDGSELVNITKTPNVLEKSLSILSNGKKMIYTVDDDIQIMDIKSKKVKKLTNTPNPEYYVAISPNGEKVAFSTFMLGENHYNFDIYLMDINKKNISRLTNTDEDVIEDNPIFSPDGKKIAFNLYQKGNYDICIINADGSGLRNLTNSPLPNYNQLRSIPSWSPDSRKITFSFPTYKKDAPYDRDIYLVDLDK